MQNFDFKRFQNVLRYTFLYNKAEYISLFIKAFVILFVVYLLVGGAIFGDIENDIDISGCVGISYALLAIMLIWTPSRILSNMHNKQTTIDYLMLPASSLEKYLGRIVSTFAYLIVIIMGAIAADAGQWLVSLIRHSITQTGSVTLTCLHGIYYMLGDGGTSVDFPDILMSFVLFIWWHSLYVLGGSVFRKSPWVITSLILGFVFTAFSSVIVCAAVNLIPNGYCLEFDDYASEIVCTLVFVLFAGINYYTSYRIFQRLQVITHKWINL